MRGGRAEGCGGYEEARGDAAAAATARSSEQASDAARAQGAIADQLGYVLDPGQTALIDERLGKQMETTMAAFADNRVKLQRERNLIKLKDSDTYKRAKQRKEESALRSALRRQRRAAEQLPLQAIALPPVNR